MVTTTMATRRWSCSSKVRAMTKSQRAAAHSSLRSSWSRRRTASSRRRRRVCISDSTPGDGGPTVAVAEVAAHPSFDAVTYANDIGVVVLAAAAPVAPTAWRSTPLEASLVGATVRIVGFGVDSSSGDGSRQKRTGTTTVNAEAAESFDFGADPSMTCFGDSGGPAFATIDGQEVLVGVTSTGDPACAAWGRDTRVDAYASFVGAFSSSGLGQGTSHGCGLGGSAGGTPATSAIAIVSLLAVRRSRRARRATRESAAEAA